MLKIYLNSQNLGTPWDLRAPKVCLENSGHPQGLSGESMRSKLIFTIILRYFTV